MRNLNDIETTWLAATRRRTAHQRLAEWKAADPSLRSIGTFDDFTTLASGPAGDNTLLALARLAPTNELAALTLMRAVLPGLIQIAARHRTMRLDAPAGELLLGIAWERIVTYPTSRRPRAVAANILADSRKWLIAHRPPNEVQLTPQPADHRDPANVADTALSRVLFEDFTATLAAAVAGGEIEAAALTALPARLSGPRNPDGAPLSRKEWDAWTAARTYMRPHLHRAVEDAA